MEPTYWLSTLPWISHMHLKLSTWETELIFLLPCSTLSFPSCVSYFDEQPIFSTNHLGQEPRSQPDFLFSPHYSQLIDNQLLSSPPTKKKSSSLIHDLLSTLTALPWLRPSQFLVWNVISPNSPIHSNSLSRFLTTNIFLKRNLIIKFSRLIANLVLHVRDESLRKRRQHEFTKKNNRDQKTTHRDSLRDFQGMCRFTESSH